MVDLDWGRATLTTQYSQQDSWCRADLIVEKIEKLLSGRIDTMQQLLSLNNICSDAKGRKVIEIGEGFQLREAMQSYIVVSDCKIGHIDLPNTYFVGINDDNTGCNVARPQCKHVTM